MPWRSELVALTARLDLRVVYALEHAPAAGALGSHETWTERAGFLDETMLDAHLPAVEDGTHHVFVCGPEAMMDRVEGHLIVRGIPITHLHSEHFAIA